MSKVRHGLGPRQLCLIESLDQVLFIFTFILLLQKYKNISQYIEYQVIFF